MTVDYWDGAREAASKTDCEEAENAQDQHEDRGNRSVVVLVAVILLGEIQRVSVDDPSCEGYLEKTRKSHGEAGRLQGMDAAEAA